MALLMGMAGERFAVFLGLGRRETQFGRHPAGQQAVAPGPGLEGDFLVMGELALVSFLAIVEAGHRRLRSPGLVAVNAAQVIAGRPGFLNPRRMSSRKASCAASSSCADPAMTGP